jgi:Flp pilus assembly protein TadG
MYGVGHPNGERAVSRERGQSLVEFALIAPLLVLLLLAIFDFGRAIYAYNTISNAAREGARIAIVDQGPASGVSLAAKEAANQATALGLNPADPTQVQVSYFVPDLSVACPTHAVNCVAEVRVQYQFRAVTPVIGNIIGPINLSTTTQIPIERTFQSP